MKKTAFIVFALLLVLFLMWNIHRSGMLNRESEDIIARADYLIARSERSIERWGNK